jgi:cell division septation protein DedD
MLGAMDSTDSQAGATAVPEPVGLAPGRALPDRPIDICPYLLAAGGDWRASSARRDHRCAALQPPASLSSEKQRRLCLTPDHAGCATYVAAAEARRARVGSTAIPERVGRWALARSPLLVEDPGGIRSALANALTERRGWQLVPALLLVIAAAMLGLGGIGRGSPQTALGSPEVSLAPTSTAPATPPPAPSPGPTLTPAPTEPPAPSPSATPAPSARTSYRVVPNDTLYDIARKFNTTTKAIMTLNGLKTTVLHAGQLLLIP